jgi:hypothetical protein
MASQLQQQKKQELAENVKREIEKGKDRALLEKLKEERTWLAESAMFGSKTGANKLAICENEIQRLEKSIKKK